MASLGPQFNKYDERGRPFPPKGMKWSSEGPLIPEDQIDPHTTQWVGDMESERREDLHQIVGFRGRTPEYSLAKHKEKMKRKRSGR